MVMKMTQRNISRGLQHSSKKMGILYMCAGLCSALYFLFFCLFFHTKNSLGTHQQFKEFLWLLILRLSMQHWLKNGEIKAQVSVFFYLIETVLGFIFHSMIKINTQKKKRDDFSWASCIFSPHRRLLGITYAAVDVPSRTAWTHSHSISHASHEWRFYAATESLERLKYFRNSSPSSSSFSPHLLARCIIFLSTHQIVIAALNFFDFSLSLSADCLFFCVFTYIGMDFLMYA